MGRLIEAVGKYTENPYYIAQADTAVHCVEELCYVLCRNTFLLDRGILDPELAKWLDVECGLPKLARELQVLLHQNGSPSAMVGIILEYASYGTQKERQETEELLRKSVDMDASARRKAFADYLAENGRYAQAVTEYDRILADMPSMNHTVRSEVMHNKGVALCRLFAFGAAAEVFLGACQENPENEEAGIHYLTALRLSLSEEDYIAFMAEHKMWYEQSLEVEKKM